MHAVAPRVLPRDAVTCGITRCKLELPSGSADIPGHPASALIVEQLLARDKYKVVGIDLQYTTGRPGIDQKVAVA